MMFKAIAFKEWLKIRWAFAAMALVCLVMLGNIVLNLKHDMEFNKPISVWGQTIFLGAQFYGGLRYVPFLVGLVIAAAQFIPEMVTGRLKLSLHLPIRENAVVMQMLGVGFTVLVSLLLLILLLLSAISLAFFPLEVLVSALLTSAPWFLAGLVGYLALSSVVVEPRWVRRVFVLVAGFAFVDALLMPVWYEVFAGSMLLFAFAGALFIPAVLLSAHRFRRGVR